MLKYRFNVGDALERAGFNTYKAQKTKILSADTLKKIKREDTGITLQALNQVCMILDMQPGDILRYVPDETDRKNKEKLF